MVVKCDAAFVLVCVVNVSVGAVEVGFIVVGSIVVGANVVGIIVGVFVGIVVVGGFVGIMDGSFDGSFDGSCVGIKVGKNVLISLYSNVMEPSNNEILTFVVFESDACDESKYNSMIAVSILQLIILYCELLFSSHENELLAEKLATAITFEPI